MPGSFTRGTNHFAHSGRPADTAVEAEYETRYAGLMDQVARKLADLSPADRVQPQPECEQPRQCGTGQHGEDQDLQGGLVVEPVGEVAHEGFPALTASSPTLGPESDGG